jgi:hypothetical protein
VNDDIFITRHFSLKQSHIDFINSINSDNNSAGLQYIIDQQMKQKQITNRDKLALNLSLGLLLIGFGLVQNIWYTSIIFYGAGIGGICYGLFYYLEHKRGMKI